MQEAVKMAAEASECIIEKGIEIAMANYNIKNKTKEE